MIKIEVETKDGKKGVSIVIRGSDQDLYNEFRALYMKITSDRDIYRIANDALDSVEHDIIQNYKENK